MQVDAKTKSFRSHRREQPTPPSAGEALVSGPRRPAAPTGGRPRRSLVVLVGTPRTGDSSARALTRSLSELGVETTYLGVETDAARLAAAVAAHRADAVELCMSSGGRGVLLLRTLLRELVQIGRGHVSVVVHRLD